MYSIEVDYATVNIRLDDTSCTSSTDGEGAALNPTFGFLWRGGLRLCLYVTTTKPVQTFFPDRSSIMSLNPSLSESPLALKDLFAHPDGLTAGRSLVADILLGWHTSGNDGQSSQELIHATASGRVTEPKREKPDTIEDLLAFRETSAQQTMVSGFGDAIKVQGESRGASDKCKTPNLKSC